MSSVHDHFMTQGVFCWNELMTVDTESARNFYSELFGWTYDEMPTGCGGGTYTIAKRGDKPVAGMFKRPPEVPAELPPQWGSWITVDDVDAMAAKVTELGGSILFGPADIPKVGRFAVIQDLQGAAVSIITHADEVKEGACCCCE